MIRSDALPRLEDYRRGKARCSLSERLPHKHDYTPALTPQTARAISTKTHTPQTAGNQRNSEVVEAAVTQHYPNSMYGALIRVCAWGTGRLWRLILPEKRISLCRRRNVI